VKKLYCWIDGPAGIARIGAPGEGRVERGGTLRLTARQLDYYRARGFRFTGVKEVKPSDDEPVTADGEPA